MEVGPAIPRSMPPGLAARHHGLPRARDVASIVGPILRELQDEGSVAEAETADGFLVPGQLQEQRFLPDKGGAVPLKEQPQADETDAAEQGAALKAADEAIEKLLVSPRRRSWLQPVEEETSDGEVDKAEVGEEAPPMRPEQAVPGCITPRCVHSYRIDTPVQVDQQQKPRSALFYELTETSEYANEDTIEADYGFSMIALQRIEEQFRKKEKAPQFFYELTEEVSTIDGDWQDSEFGLADWQLEELWKRFESRVVVAPAVAATVVPDGAASHDDEPSSEEHPQTPRSAEVSQQDKGGDSPCPAVLQSVEEVVGNAGLKQLHDFLGDHTLEQFIGQKVVPLPFGGMRAWMLSTRQLDGEDWYLFKVTDRGTNRFYMKSFFDFEELHEALLLATPAGRALPALPQRDFLGLKRWMLGSDFSDKRTQHLRAYVDELMMQFLTPSQEQALRNFFGPVARGRVLPPPGETPTSQNFGPKLGTVPLHRLGAL